MKLKKDRHNWWRDEYGLSFNEAEVEKLNNATVIDGFYIYGGLLLRYDGNEEDIVIPDNVVTICGRAFVRKSIKSLKLNDGLKEIRENAFIESEIDSLIIPESLEQIGTCAFGLSEIKSIVSHSSKFVFENNGLYEYLYPKSKRLIRYIGEELEIGTIDNHEYWDTAAFLNIKLPEHFIIPQNVSLSYMTFAACYGVRVLEFPSSYEIVDTDELFPFASCSELEKIILQEGVCSIGDRPPTYSKWGTIEYIIDAVRRTKPKCNTSGYKISRRILQAGAFRFDNVETMIPNSINHIAGMHKNCNIICYENSYAYEYAVKHGIRMRVLRK